MGKAEVVLGAVLLSAVVAALVASSTGGAPGNWLYHYQTFIIGLLTVIGAGVAAFLLYRQTRQEADIAADIKEGQRQAARSWLSLHLSAIIRYSRDTGKGMWRLIGACDERGQLPDNVPIPTLPDIPMEAAVAVKQYAQFASPDEAKFIAVMFSTMQVLDARVEGLKSSRRAGSNILNLESYLKDSAELYARSEALLNFARHATNEFPSGVTWERYSAAFFDICKTHEPTERISRHIEQGARGDPTSFLPNRFERERQ